MSSTLQSCTQMIAETQILQSSLRLSLMEEDKEGLDLAYRELSHLYPDLSPDDNSEKPQRQNSYETLMVDSDANRMLVRTAYHKAYRRFLRNNQINRGDNTSFLKLLNSGVVLSNKRLRLSHDLHLAAGKQSSCPGNNRKVTEIDEDFGEIEYDLPPLLDLIHSVNAIKIDELEALVNQSRAYPEASLEELILQAGYLEQRDLNFFNRSLERISFGLMTRSEFSKKAYSRQMDSVSHHK